MAAHEHAENRHSSREHAQASNCHAYEPRHRRWLPIKLICCCETSAVLVRAACRHFAWCVAQMASERQGQEASVPPAAKKADAEPLDLDSPGTATVTDRLERLKRARAVLPSSAQCQTVNQGLESA